MPATVTSITPRRAAPPPSPDAGGPAPKRPLRDNPRLILAGIALLLAVLVGLVALANRTPQFTPDFLTEFVLYALSAADLTMLVALVFVLARNIVKLVVERRRGLPFARFRAKLVALLLGMTLVPTIIVLMVGSELIRTNIDRWFNSPMEEILDVGEGDRRRLLPGAPDAGERPRRAHGAAPRRRRPDESRRRADSRSAGAGGDDGPRAAGRGLPRRPGGRSVARRRAGRRRGRAGVAARIQRRRRRSPRGAGAERLARDALDRNPR